MIEDLNVTVMVSNRRLARAVSDQGFGVARRMLGYKTAREGGTLIVADRDVNAARNLLSLAAGGADRVNACGAPARPGLTVGQGTVKQEPGTPHGDQTGTAAPQEAAAA